MTCLNVAVSMVTLIDADGSSLNFGFQAGSTIADVLQAQAKMTGTFRVLLISDEHGHFLPFNHPIEAAQCIQVFLSSNAEGEVFTGQSQQHGPDCGESQTDLPDVEMVSKSHGPLSSDPGKNVAASPVTRESGQLPIMPEVGSGHDLDLSIDKTALSIVNPISPTIVWQPSGSGTPGTAVQGASEQLLPTLWGSVSALLGLTVQQFLHLSVPCIGDPSKLLS